MTTYDAVGRALAQLVHNTTDRLDEFETRLNRTPLPSSHGDGFNSRGLAQECSALAQFSRTGDFKNLSIGSDPDGGYFSFPEVSNQIFAKLRDQSPIASLARIQTLSNGGEFIEPIDGDDADCAWVGESESRPETSAGDIALNKIPLSESYALVKITQRLLDDSSFDVGAWVMAKLADRFGRLAGEAFVSGNSVNRPTGFLTYSTSSDGDSTRAKNTYQFVPSGASTTLTADSILDLFYSLRSVYRQNATFVMSSDTARIVRKLKDGDGSYIWAPGLGVAPDRLCGRPVAYDESMPAVGSGSFPIAVADWRRAYLIVQRPGLKFLQDPYSAKPHVLLYSTMRIGAQSSGDFDALKILKIAAS